MYNTPLMELLYQAATVHRMYNDPAMVRCAGLRGVHTHTTPTRAGVASGRRARAAAQGVRTAAGQARGRVAPPSIQNSRRLARPLPLPPTYLLGRPPRPPPRGGGGGAGGRGAGGPGGGWLGA